jgi:hypothetical protein
MDDIEQLAESTAAEINRRAEGMTSADRSKADSETEAILKAVEDRAV